MGFPMLQSAYQSKPETLQRSKGNSKIHRAWKKGSALPGALISHDEMSLDILKALSQSNLSLCKHVTQNFSVFFYSITQVDLNFAYQQVSYDICEYISCLGLSCLRIKMGFFLSNGSAFVFFLPFALVIIMYEDIQPVTSDDFWSQPQFLMQLEAESGYAAHTELKLMIILQASKGLGYRLTAPHQAHHGLLLTILPFLDFVCLFLNVFIYFHQEWLLKSSFHLLK